MSAALEVETGRSARAELVFAAGGGRTVLTRQLVPYPFHVTRPFHLDRECPDLATLYLQSASGGLYRGDDLGLSIRVRPGGRAHVATQSVTIVHDTGFASARQRVDIAVASGGFLAYTPDPFVLFPGADMCSETNITIGADARAIIFDGFAWHDPQNEGRPFANLTLTLQISDEASSCLVREKAVLQGSDFLAAASPLGQHRAYASAMLLGPASILPPATRMRHACEPVGCLAGVSSLPNGAGQLIRCLAKEGGDLRRGLAEIFREAFSAMVGTPPALRPK